MTQRDPNPGARESPFGLQDYPVVNEPGGMGFRRLGLGTAVVVVWRDYFTARTTPTTTPRTCTRSRTRGG